MKFRNISLYFAIDMEQTGDKSYGKGREAGVKGTGSGSKRYGGREVQTPLSPHPPPKGAGHDILASRVPVKPVKNNESSI